MAASDEPDDPGHGKRLIKLTPMAQVKFNEAREVKESLLKASWAEVSPLTRMSLEVEYNEPAISNAIKELQQKFSIYKRHTNSYILFLEGVRSEQSLTIKSETENILRQRQELVDKCVLALRSSLPSLPKKPSSTISRSSTSTSKEAAKARAKAEAAKARLSFLEKEAKLKQQKLAIENELDYIAAEREVASAIAEADALELGASSQHSACSLSSLPVENKHLRTSNYVQDVRSHNAQSNLNEQSSLNPEAVPFTASQRPSASTDLLLASEMTKLLLKKDLLFVSLTHFDDNPENYQSWKHSFKSKILELSVSPLEEIDLLVKWTGSQSRQQVISLRSAYFSNPSQGIVEIWKRLDERFGSPVNIESSLKKKLSNFPKLSSRDSKRFYELADILNEILAIKRDDKYSSVLAYFDSSSGINPIVSKLPSNLQDKWTLHAAKYIESHNVIYPPFECFCQFISKTSSLRNNPNFIYDVPNVSPRESKPNIHTRKTNSDVNLDARTPISKNSKTELCPLHQLSHSLNICKQFKSKPFDVRKKFLSVHNLCFKCCQPGHTWNDCVTAIKCDDCGSTKHVGAMHLNFTNKKVLTSQNQNNEETDVKETITSTCTQLCNDNFTGKSCSKIAPLWVLHESRPDLKFKVYSIIDDQSNKSLIGPELLDRFSDIITFPQVAYSLTSCSGVTETSGRRAGGFLIKSLDETVTYDLPAMMECDKIPKDKHEIPTPEVVRHHQHLSDLVNEILPLDPNCDILLLLGRDIGEVHHVHNQRIGPKGSPYAQKLGLGWVVVGETCLSGGHLPDRNISTFRTKILQNGRPSVLTPCPNQLVVKEIHQNYNSSDIFEINQDSEKIGMSIEDEQFIRLMEAEFKPDSQQRWTAPLPFKLSRSALPNNRHQAWKRAQILHTSLEKNPTKKEHMFQFMKGILKGNHAEVAPHISPSEECWYLPLFGVYHPRKKEKIRGVFDSSAEYKGISLNDVLMKGPDMTNSLLGVLLRFRRGPVAVSCDIEQMFYCFAVCEDHRNFLRFFWYKNNQPSEKLIEYRMCKHVFGNKPSPAVANFGLRQMVQDSESDIRSFVQNNFYVDDGLAACDDEETAISLIKRTQNALSKNGNVRLHKIMSNSQAVLEAFDPLDVAKDVSGIDLRLEDSQLQGSLGVKWDLKMDTLTFDISTESKPYTRRGVLSTINSIYDPLGFAAPVTIKGKLLLRDMLANTNDWD